MNHEKKTKAKIPIYLLFITEKELSNNSWLGLYEAKVETTVYKVFEKKKKKRQEVRERT